MIHFIHENGWWNGPSRKARGRRTYRHVARPGLLELEHRQLLSTFTVANASASGTGSLAAAVASADSDNHANTIIFSATFFNTPKTITLGASALELSDTHGTQTITGPAAGVTIVGGSQSGVFQVDEGVAAKFSGLTITGGKVGDRSSGGGLENAGTASLTDCTISGNSAGENGGGLYNSVAGVLTLTGCTLSGNDAGNAGAGLYNSGVASLTDCTISANSAKVLGGGLSSDGTLALIDCTISANQSGQLGGGLANGGTATVSNTIVAANTKPTGASDIHSPGSLKGSDNLIGTGGSGTFMNGVSNNIVLKSLSSLGLTALGFYGGPTQTIWLDENSAAIGLGAEVNGVIVDQRGFPLDSPAPDIGAFQSQPFITLTASAGTAVFGQTVTFVATVSGIHAGVPIGGTVTFPNAGAALGEVAIDSSGKATLSTSSFTIGANAITAVYRSKSGLPNDFVTSAVVIVDPDSSRVMPTAREEFKKKKIVSVTLEARIGPVAPGCGRCLTGTVTFEQLQKNKKPKILGKAALGGAIAKLSVKPASVLKKTIEFVYSGDSDFDSSTKMEMLT